MSSGRFAELERKAAEKKAKEAANDPVGIARGKLHVLWKRAYEAHQKIVPLLEKAKTYRREFQIIGVPEKLFAAPSPNEVPQSEPYGWTLEDFAACTAGATPKIIALEEQLGKLGQHVSDWERLSPEMQNRKLILAMRSYLGGK